MSSPPVASSVTRQRCVGLSYASTMRMMFGWRRRFNTSNSLTRSWRSWSHIALSSSLTAYRVPSSLLSTCFTFAKWPRPIVFSTVYFLYSRWSESTCFAKICGDDGEPPEVRAPERIDRAPTLVDGLPLVSPTRAPVIGDVPAGTDAGVATLRAPVVGLSSSSAAAAATVATSP